MCVTEVGEGRALNSQRSSEAVIFLVGVRQGFVEDVKVPSSMDVALSWLWLSMGPHSFRRSSRDGVGGLE